MMTKFGVSDAAAMAEAAKWHMAVTARTNRVRIVEIWCITYGSFAESVGEIDPEKWRCALGGHRQVGIKFITTGLIDERKSANLGEYIANYVGMKKTQENAENQHSSGSQSSGGGIRTHQRFAGSRATSSVEQDLDGLPRKIYAKSEQHRGHSGYTPARTRQELSQMQKNSTVNHSDYIVYVDESGDPGLKNIDPTYPLFVLAFCIFHKTTYIDSVVPALQRFKFKHFGHDMVVLHEHEIRKTEGSFKILFNKERRDEFQTDLSKIIETAEFALVASVVRKHSLKGRIDDGTNLYHIALRLGLESIFHFLAAKGQDSRTTFVVFEARGRNEDKDLELEFRRVCDGQNTFNSQLPFDIIIAAKQCNSSGLQLADLVARPIGRKTLKPDQANRAYDILAKKFASESNGNATRQGLTLYPA